MSRKNDIAEIYKRRKEEFVLTPPEDGWGKLEKELGSFPKRSFLPYSRIAVAATILLCVGMLIPFLIPKKNMEQLSYVPEITKEKNADLEQSNRSFVEDIVPRQQQIEIPSITTEELPAVLLREDDIDKEESHVATTNEPEEQETLIEHEKEEPNKVKHSKAGPQPLSQPIKVGKNATKREKLTIGKKWSVDLIVGSNGMASGGSQNSYVFVPPPNENDYGSNGEGDDDDEKDKNVDTRSFISLRSEKEKDITYSHRLPLTASIRLSRYLSERFAVETGLSFTYLSADIKHLSIEKGEQNVYYLGVPVKANWSFFQRGRFQTYLTAGGMLEYCLSAQQKLGGQKASLDINRWQWSLHAAAGAQLEVVRPLSLFIEPGLSYYFEQNKNRPFETSRTEHPLSFSLQFGVRFTY